MEALKDRKVRSALTILMVVVGSTLMVALNSFTAGFGEFINRQFSNLATNILTLSTSQDEGDGPGSVRATQGTQSAAKITFNSAVISKLKSLPFVDDVIPSYSDSVTLESQGRSRSASVYSVDPQKLLVIAPSLELVEGSSIRQNDPSAMIVADSIANPEGESTPFLVIGQTVRATYSFVDPDTGEEKEESRSFVVRGIMEETGNPTIDRAIVINLEVGNALMHKSQKYDSIQVVAEYAEYVNVVEEEIREIYGDNVGISTPQASLETQQQISGGFQSFITSIATVALVVGAVGTVTTLYTSVNERTREIGTMKSIGALNRDILLIFLSEASIIGIIGATVGLALGIGGGYILTNVMSFGPVGGLDISPVFRPSDLAYVWALSVGLSLLAGAYPAWKASGLDPIVALRRE
jgi:putative ABC transport system permease protein